MEWTTLINAGMGLLCLGCIGLMHWNYRRKMRRFKGRISIEDIALMKIIRDSANHIWEKNRPRKNVIQLEDYKKGYGG